MKKKSRWLAPAIIIAASIYLGLIQAAAGCDRACLKDHLDGFLDALERLDAETLPMAVNHRVTLNGDAMPLMEALQRSTGRARDFRLEAFDPERGDAAVMTVVNERDGVSVYMVRLKVGERGITEVEKILAREGDAGALWDPDNLMAVSPNFTLSIRPAERNSYYELIAAADAYWRAFQTNGGPDYRPAPFLPDAVRYENGLQTTGVARNGQPARTPAQQFDEGLFPERDIYDRRFPVVDEESGVVLSIVRFGTKPGWDQVRPDRLVAEFFAVHAGMLQEIQVVIRDRPRGAPTGW